MNDNLCYASVATPSPRKDWLQLSDNARLDLVKNTLALSPPAMNKILAAKAATQDGQVIISFLEPIGADRRGTILLDLEKILKDAIDPGLTVWLEPLGDRNSLRNLRGIVVKV